MSPFTALLFRLGVRRRFAVDWRKASHGVAIVSDVVVRRETKDFQVLSTLLMDGIPLYVVSHGWQAKSNGMGLKGMHQAVLQTPARAWLTSRVLGQPLRWQAMLDQKETRIRPVLERSSFAVYDLVEGDPLVKLKRGYTDVGRVNLLGRQGVSFNLAPLGRGKATIWADRELPDLVLSLVRPLLVDFLNLNMHRLKANTLIHWSEEEVLARVARNLDLQEFPGA